MNPKDLAMMLLKQNMGANPMVSDLMRMANNNDFKSIENLARSIYQKKGVDIDQAIKDLMPLITK